MVSFMSLDYEQGPKLVGFAAFLLWIFWITHKSGQIAMNPVLAVLGWKLYEIKYTFIPAPAYRCWSRAIQERHQAGAGVPTERHTGCDDRQGRRRGVREVTTLADLKSFDLEDAEVTVWVFNNPVAAADVGLRAVGSGLRKTWPLGSERPLLLISAGLRRLSITTYWPKITRPARLPSRPTKPTRT